jgi:CubicO group peptidase (beta-lactamase class C family)
MTDLRPLFDDAIRFAQHHEVGWTRDPHAEPDRWGVHRNDPPPWNRLFGPVHARGPVSGVILRKGSAIAEWGEPDRADLTFSVAKTYLALLAGVAHRQGLLPDPDEPVVARLPAIGFESAHNRAITWMHLLTQTSEWEGTCHGIDDVVDRYRQTSHAPSAITGVKGTARPLQSPGSYWEYNDVRINQLSLALLHLFGRPLPEVFRECILDPLGASADVRWTGYDQAWVELPARAGHPARRVQSVPGGTHWGGGVSIGARDQARIGQLLLDRGAIRSPDGLQQVIPAAWVDRMRSPCPIAPFYGMLVWLNPAGKTFPGASAESVFMVGAGGNYVWIEPAYDAVIVVRWIDSAHFDEFTRRVASALRRAGANA